MNRTLVYTFMFPGTFTADTDPYFTLPFDVQLIHVSAQCLDEDATLIIQDDTVAVNDTLTVTNGTTPVTQDEKGDFVGDQFPHMLKGSVIHLDIAHGSEFADLVVVLTMTEG
jgi:hypothetical protein